jgi:hypothetical protein
MNLANNRSKKLGTLIDSTRARIVRSLTLVLNNKQIVYYLYALSLTINILINIYNFKLFSHLRY